MDHTDTVVSPTRDIHQMQYLSERMRLAFCVRDPLTKLRGYGMFVRGQPQNVLERSKVSLTLSQAWPGAKMEDYCTLRLVVR